jgi:hypothetical protein
MIINRIFDLYPKPLSKTSTISGPERLERNKRNGDKMANKQNEREGQKGYINLMTDTLEPM